MPNVPVLALALTLSSAAHAQVTIYAVNNFHGSGQSDSLVRFQSDNPAGWTTIGATGVLNVQFTGLEFAGANGGLYAWAGPGLYSIDPNTGAATLLQQGPPATGVRDLSWNPVTNQMIGLVANPCHLVSIDLSNGATTFLGFVTGIPSPGGTLVEGLAHDSFGNIFIHDYQRDEIYFGSGLTVAPLHTNLPNGEFSQGMTVDWSRDNRGYHAAFGQLPQFYSQLYSFTSAPNSYSLVGNFSGPPGTPWTFEGGDLAIRPVPAPATLLGLGALIARRRRRL